MKKRRNTLIFNIITICLSICAIAIGVYSLQNASLGVNGSVGFVAHECKVNISAYMYGYATEVNGMPVEEPTQDSEKHYLTYGDSKTEATEKKPLMVYDNQNTGLSFNIGTGNGIYFSNMSVNDVVEPITIVLTVTNGTQNLILVEDNTSVASDAKYSVDCDNYTSVLNSTDDNKTTTITYTLLPAKDDAGKYVNITTMVNVALSMNFSKIDTTNISTTGFETSGTRITEVPTKEVWGSDILIIPSNINGTACTTIETPQNVKDYRVIILLEGITSLSMESFYGCTNLTSVVLPERFTSFNYASFGGCSNLKSINFPKTITSWGGFTFEGCGFTSIVLPESMTTTGSSMFEDCTKLKKVQLPNSLTDIYPNTFKGCTSLSEITLPTNLETISSSACEGCTSLTEMTLPSKLKTIASAALKGTNITSITIPKSLTSFSFSDSNLKNVEFEDGDERDNLPEGAFTNCTQLTSFTIPSTVKTINMSVFSGCTGLKSIVIPSSVTTIGTNAFNNCTNLTSVIFEVKTGWSAGSTSISESDLSNTATAATYLKSTYSSPYWRRT